jgi:DNA-binding XRE family transcriptional regulator
MDAIASNPMSSPPGDRDDSAEATAPALTIAALRAELGLTQQEFGERIGLPNKTSVSLLESGKRPSCSVAVAIAIEALSVADGAPRIDAADLSDDVKLSRHGCACTDLGVQDHG